MAYAEPRAEGNEARGGSRRGRSDGDKGTGGGRAAAGREPGRNDGQKKRAARAGRALAKTKELLCYWFAPLWQSEQVRSGSSSPPGCLNGMPFAEIVSRAAPLPWAMIVWQEVQSLERMASPWVVL